jgi:hypothetical protein
VQEACTGERPGDQRFWAEVMVYVVVCVCTEVLMVSLRELDAPGSRSSLRAHPVPTLTGLSIVDPVPRLYSLIPLRCFALARRSRKGLLLREQSAGWSGTTAVYVRIYLLGCVGQGVAAPCSKRSPSAPRRPVAYHSADLRDLALMAGRLASLPPRGMLLGVVVRRVRLQAIGPHASMLYCSSCFLVLLLLSFLFLRFFEPLVLHYAVPLCFAVLESTPRDPLVRKCIARTPLVRVEGRVEGW